MRVLGRQGIAATPPCRLGSFVYRAFIAIAAVAETWIDRWRHRRPMVGRNASGDAPEDRL